MDHDALERAKRHIEEAREGRAPQRLDATLERARVEVEALATAATDLATTLPDRIGDAMQEGLRREVSVVARNLAEIRGLLNNAIRRLERLEEEVLTERSARIDDLALLVDLVSAGWQSVDARLELLERPMSSTQLRPFAADAAA
jgi:hypothetical protein